MERKFAHDRIRELRPVHRPNLFIGPTVAEVGVFREVKRADDVVLHSPRRLRLWIGQEFVTHRGEFHLPGPGRLLRRLRFTHWPQLFHLLALQRLTLKTTRAALLDPSLGPLCLPALPGHLVEFVDVTLRTANVAPATADGHRGHREFWGAAEEA
jgi:hypothetical protein